MVKIIICFGILNFSPKYNIAKNNNAIKNTLKTPAIQRKIATINKKIPMTINVPKLTCAPLPNFFMNNTIIVPAINPAITDNAKSIVVICVADTWNSSLINVVNDVNNKAIVKAYKKFMIIFFHVKPTKYPSSIDMIRATVNNVTDILKPDTCMKAGEMVSAGKNNAVIKVIIIANPNISTNISTNFPPFIFFTYKLISFFANI